MGIARSSWKWIVSGVQEKLIGNADKSAKLLLENTLALFKSESVVEKELCKWLCENMRGKWYRHNRKCSHGASDQGFE
jgi:hypothetical protein